MLSVRRPKIPGVLDLAWPVLAWFTNRVFAEDCAIVEMEQAMLFVMRVSDTSVLAVTTGRPCDVGLVGYEMAVLVEKCAEALTPGLISELQTALPRSAIR